MLYNLLQLGDSWLDEAGLYWVLQVLYQREFRAFAAVILAFLIVMVFGKRTIRWLVRMKIGDVPEFNQVDINTLMAEKSNTPTMGGVLLVAAIVISTSLLADMTNRYVHMLLITFLVLGALGAADDWLKLTAARRTPGSRDGLYRWEKMLFQVGLGAVIGLFAWKLAGDSEAARSLTLPFMRTYVPGTETLTVAPTLIVLSAGAFITLAIVMVSGFANAVNITDGLDGLAPGTVMIASFAMMVLSNIAGSSDLAGHLLLPFVDGAAELMIVAGAMAGACLGFLWFNCKPAQVFMGDTGSLPLGGGLAAIAVIIREEFLLILIGGVFVVEIGSVILQVGWFRMTGGKRIFGCTPIHHHFHLKGWSESQVVVRFWVAAVVFAMIALVSIKLR